MGLSLTDILLLGNATSEHTHTKGFYILGKRKLLWGAIGRIIDVVVSGVPPLSLPDAVAADIPSLIAFGGTEQRDIPDNYLQRQFIYMMDGSYLLTDIVPTYDGRIEMDFQTTSTISQAATYLSSSTALRFAHISAKTFRVNAWGNTYDSTTPVANDTRYKFIYDNLVATLKTGDTTVFTNTFTDTGTTTAPLTINGYGSPVSQNVEGIYLYSFRVWNGQGELVADYVPAVQRGTVPVVGFYDTVTGDFRTPTAGTFAAGGEAVPTPDTPMDIVCNNGVLKARHQSGLPLGYTLLDSVVFDSTQVIDTDFIPDNNSRIESKCYRTGADCWFYGAGPSNPRVTLYHSSTGACRWGNQSRSSVGFVADTEYTLVQDKNGITANNTLLPWNSGTAGDFTCDRTLTIGNCNGATGTRYFAGNFYYMKIYNNGVLARDFVPCQNASNVVGLYDRVNGVFYTDTGLVAGNPVSDPVEIYTDGTVETIAIKGPNIFDNANTSLDVGQYLHVDTHDVRNGTNELSVIYQLVPGKTYTLTRLATGASIKIRLGFFDTATPAVGSVASDYMFDNNFDTTSLTFTVPAGKPYMFATLANSTNSGRTITEQQCLDAIRIIETVSTATCEDLLSVGTYTDEQEVISGGVTRQIEVRVFDGTENWGASSTYQGSCWLNLPKSSQAGICVCSHFSNVPSVATYARYKVLNEGIAINLWYGDNRTTAVADLKAFLAQQYAAGTPVILLRALTTSTTESVAAQPMQTAAGDNMLEITQASLNNLELEVTYKKQQ